MLLELHDGLLLGHRPGTQPFVQAWSPYALIAFALEPGL